MNSGYAKLFSTIVTSTIWREDDKTRVLWITMLAICDKFGMVAASVPGLAAVANLTLPDCEAALDRLSSPDKYSRTREHEGRRIEARDGGWKILNYGKYRELGRSVERREYLRVKQQESRARRQQKSTLSTTSTDINRSQPISEATADPESRSKEQISRGGDQIPPTPRELTGHALAQLFGRVRERVLPGTLAWVGAKDAKGSGTALAAELNAAGPEVRADVEPTMVLLLERARDGASGGQRGDLVASDPSFGFGAWCSSFTALREDLHGKSPKRNAKSSVSVGHVRAEVKPRESGEVKL